MRFSPSRVGATAVLVLFAGAGAGCTLVNKVRAKNELNETARSYREGRFEEAEQPEKRAEAYAILAGKDWDCSFKVTELPDVKITSTEGGNAKVTYKKPKEQKDFDTIQQCVARGLEEAETAIKYDPNNESAWSYKTNLLIEAAKIADMNGEADKKAQYTRQAEVAQKRASELAEERRKKEEAAAPSPTP